MYRENPKARRASEIVLIAGTIAVIAIMIVITYIVAKGI